MTKFGKVFEQNEINDMKSKLDQLRDNQPKEENRKVTGIGILLVVLIGGYFATVFIFPRSGSMFFWLLLPIGGFFLLIMVCSFLIGRNFENKFFQYTHESREYETTENELIIRGNGILQTIPYNSINELKLVEQPKYKENSMIIRRRWDFLDVLFANEYYNLLSIKVDGKEVRIRTAEVEKLQLFNELKNKVQCKINYLSLEKTKTRRYQIDNPWNCFDIIFMCINKVFVIFTMPAVEADNNSKAEAQKGKR